MPGEIPGPDSDEEGAKPRIEAHPSRDGLRLVDPIEKSQFTLLTPESVQPEPCDTAEFYFPVDTAARIQTTEFETPYFVNVWIRDESGELVSTIQAEGSTQVPPGEYNVEISNSQLKIYILIKGGIAVHTGHDMMRFSLEKTSYAAVGIRSFHQRPAATITTTDDPEDLMAAISAFGSALKTTTCERSFPTLRGHPPLLERGDELSIPAALDVPETGVEIEVPPELEYIYSVASLAYYLGADVVPGPEPRLLADGETFSLTADGDFESTVARVLKHVFLLDCVTRTEGYYTVDLHECEVVEERVDLDFASLYDKSLAEQVRTYLSVPYEDVEAAVPRWKLTSDVVPDWGHVETLPFLANDLAVIRCPASSEIEQRTIRSHTSGSDTVDTALDGLARSHSPQSGPFREDAFRLEDDPGSVEQTYVGDGVPLGANKMTIESYHRRFKYDVDEETAISVIVVCNDSEMADENVVSEIYGSREWLDFETTIEHDLTVSEMRTTLSRDADFLHYIGHADRHGIKCSDGWLDTNTLDTVGVDSFLLNACQSYEQGRALIDAGAIGGIVTATDLLDETATNLGRDIAGLLNVGFDLLSSINLLGRLTLMDNHYLTVGDGSFQVCENKSGVPMACFITAIENDRIKMAVETYPSKNYNMGTLFHATAGSFLGHYLASGRTDELCFTREQAHDFLSLRNAPIIYDSEIFWNEDFLEDLGET